MFIRVLCEALQQEYNDEDLSNKKDLMQLFGSVVIPKVGRSEIRMAVPQPNGPDLTYIIKQTPESRSSLTKTIKFKRAPAPGVVRIIYDGEAHDPSFGDGRSYFRNIALPLP